MASGISQVRFECLDKSFQSSYAYLQWPKFQFFDKEVVKRKDGKRFEDLKVDSLATSISKNQSLFRSHHLE